MADTSIREIASAIVVDCNGKFLLQQRDDVSGIVCPGMIGMFGGHREGNESFLQCAVRELCEELSQQFLPHQLEPLTVYNGPDRELPNRMAEAHFFIVRNIPSESIVVTEGSLAILDTTDIEKISDRLTPFTRFAFEAFARTQKNPHTPE